MRWGRCVVMEEYVVGVCGWLWVWVGGGVGGWLGCGWVGCEGRCVAFALIIHISLPNISCPLNNLNGDLYNYIPFCSL